MGLSTFRIAWRNLGRNRRRTLLAVTAIALGQITLVFVNCMMAGMYAEMLRVITGPLVGHVQIHHREWREERAIDMCVENLSQARSEIEALRHVKSAWPRIYSAVLAASGEVTDQPADAEMAMIVGLEVDKESAGGGILGSLQPESMPGSKEVLVGKVLARRLGIEVGQDIAVIGQDADEFPVSDLFTVKAVVPSSTDVVNRLGIVMPLADAQEFLSLSDRAHEIVVQGDDHREAEELAARMAALPGLESAAVLPWREAAPELVTLIDMKGWMDLIFVAILFVAAAAGIVNTMMMSTFERTHEFGMLLALGTGPRRIVRMIFLESLVLGLVGVAVGSIIGSALVLITSHTGIDYGALSGVRGQEVAFRGLNFSYVIYPMFELRQIWFGVCAVTVTSVLASTWPAVLAARLEPAEAIRS